MAKKHNIEGVGAVSEETIKAALKDYFKGKPEGELGKELYVFKAGDVAERDDDGKLRVIAKCICGKIVSIDDRGWWQSSTQEEFERYGYKKVGELKDYLK